MTMRPLYIFDLDGTLALIDHRRPILDETKNPNRWRDFFLACTKDEPNGPVIRTMRRLQAFADVWIWSGRSDEVRSQTMEWIATYTSIAYPEIPEILRMRPASDHSPDELLKERWLCALSWPDRRRLEAVFDDRSKVVAMWRSYGIPCFQVAPGDF